MDDSDPHPMDDSDPHPMEVDSNTDIKVKFGRNSDSDSDSDSDNDNLPSSDDPVSVSVCASLGRICSVLMSLEMVTVCSARLQY